MILAEGDKFMETVTIMSRQDQLPLKASVLVPEGEIKGIIQLVHGMAEHRFRYESFMKELAANGFVAIMHDHRGHGESVLNKKDWGYFYENGAESIVEDTYQVTCYIKERFEDQPLILFGHSMGSLVVRAYAKRYDNEIDGLIVCGSPSENKAAGMGKALAGLIGVFCGQRHRSKLLQHIAFGSYNKGLADTVSENSWLTTRKDVVAKYDNDPACGYIFTINGFKNLFTLMQNVYDTNGWLMQNRELPILFLSGEDDPCAAGKQNFDHAVQLMKDCGYVHVDSTMYPNKRHEILNEQDCKAVYQDIIDWIYHILQL